MEAATRVAKNTLILYLRMAITLFISLYSTRLVLLALGVSDFGLFNVVGGVIAMLGFLNSSMAAATQRFMSFTHGTGDVEKIKRIFNVSTILHWGIAFVIFGLLEIVGFFLFNGILNIDPARIGMAKIIYQFMIVSTIFTVISVPYEAVLTSHENMTVYAILGVFEAVAKLGIAFYITYSSLDHLLMYGLLIAVLAIILLILKRIYCHKYYTECKINIRYYYDKVLLKEMGGYAGWSLMGNSANMITNYGQGIVINLFFGTVVNAAQGVASQISGQLNVLAITLIKALNPVLGKSEGAGNRKGMLKAAFMGSKISFFLLMLLYIPFFIELPFIFKVWLKKVPEFAIIFARLLMVRSLIEQLFITIASTISAQGNIKAFQLRASLLLLFPLIVSYILFEFGYPPYTMYIVFIVYALFASINILYTSVVNCQLPLFDFLRNVLFRCLLSFLIVFLLAIIPYIMIEESSLVRLLLVVFISSISYLFSVYFIGFTKEESLKIKEISNTIFTKVLKK